MQTKTLKKALALLLSVLVLITSLPVITISAEGNVTEDGFKYAVYEGGVMWITEYTGDSEDVVIPETIDGQPVQVISSEVFKNNTTIKSVTVPASVNSIRYDAFYKCDNLKKVYISDLKAWTDIDFNYKEANPLYNKAELYLNGELVTDLVIPDGATQTGAYAFYGCTSLKSVTVPATVTEVSVESFAYCENLETVTVAEGVNTIGSEAFYQCSNLNNISLPDSILNVGGDIFNGTALYKNEENYDEGSLYINKVLVTVNDDFETYTVKEGTKAIAEEAFAYNSNMFSVTIPEGIKVIPNSAFMGCDNLKEINLPNGLEEIDSYAFAYIENGVESITIPDGVKVIGASAFSGCSNLKEVIFPDTIEVVSSSAFWDTPFMDDEKNWDNGVFYIGSTIYSVKPDLVAEELVIKDGIKGIPSYSFSDCNNLKSIVIPEGATYIGGSAFENCINLTSITIPSTIESIDENAFYSCSSIENLYITDINAWCNIDFGYASSNPAYFAENIYVNNEIVKDIKLAEGVTVIKPYAFYSFNTLESIIIPDSLTEIGKYAFEDCEALKNVTIGKGLSTADEECFGWGHKIENVYISDVAAWCAINFADTYANPLRNDGNLYLNNELVQTLVIPDGVAKVNGYAFYGSASISNIYIPASVTEIGYGAFYVDDVSRVFYGGTEEQWKNIKIDEANSDITTAEIIYNCDEELVKNIPDDFDFRVEDGGIVIRKYKGTETDVNIPSTILGLPVIGIGASAFYDNENIKTVVIPEGVKFINNAAFGWCSNLSEVTFPSTLEEIGESAFSNCSLIKEVKLPESLKTIYGWAFQNCTSLEKINLPDSVTKIGRYAFRSCTALPEVKTPQSLTIIEEGVFNYCESLKVATITDSVTTIGYKAFEGCKSLPEVNIPKKVKFIDGRAYNGCAALEDVYYEDIKDNWDTITIVSHNDPLINATLHYLSYVVLTDDKTDISVETSKDLGAELKVVKVEDTAAIEEKLKDSDVVGLFDITLNKDGEEIQPEETVTVKIPTTSENSKVYRVEPDGTLTDMEAVFEDGFMVFETEHFSLYVLARSRVIDIDPTIPESQYSTGDVNRDGKLNIKDATAIQKYSAKMIEFDEEQTTLGDFNGDNKVNVKDATQIQKKIAGLI